MAAPVKVKICGLMRRDDVLFANSRGADYLGVILSAGFGRSVGTPEAKGLLERVSAKTVAVLVDETPDAAARMAAAIRAGVVQLHGHEAPEDVAAVSALGSWDVWKAVRVRGPSELVAAVREYSDVADGLLVEGYRRGVVGGGGVRVDLEALSQVRQQVPEALELVLAGGLTPENVAEGVARFWPSVVDVSSGVEERLGEKSESLVHRFIEEARGASANMTGAHRG